MKTLLIATTALVSIASLAVAGSVSARETASSLYQLDANREFLCNYGFTVINAAQRSSSGGSISSSFVSYSWARAATPVIGKRKKVNEIIVAESVSQSSSSNPGISVAVYSGDNQPVRELAVRQVKPSLGCGRVKVPISPTKLASGKKYWIVETALRPHFGLNGSSVAVNRVEWLYDKNQTQGGLSQSGYSCYGHCGSKHHKSGWMNIASVPYARVR